MATAIQNPYSGLPLSGGTVTGLTTFTNGLTVSGGSVTFAPNIGMTLNGNLDVSGSGNGLGVAEGAGGKQGVATLSGGTILVNNANITATSRIFLTPQDNSTTGALRVSARSAGVSFTITSSVNTDSGVVAYEIFAPG